jgi:hypothetical protein
VLQADFRLRVFLASLVLVMALVCMVRAQQPAAVDTPIPTAFPLDDPRALHRCDGGVALNELARVAHILIGFENTPDCIPSSRAGWAGYSGQNVLVFPSGTSAREALNQLMLAMPQFAWKDVDGVVVVRPTVAWENPDDLLNHPVGAFTVTDVPADRVLHSVLQEAMPSLFKEHEDVPHHGVMADRMLTVRFHGGTLLEALNEVVRAHGSAEWQIGFPGRRAIVELIALNPTLLAPGDSVLAPVAVPVHRR